MSDALSEMTVLAPSDPDAQATVTDFLDYTEYLPSDLIRSLTLVRKLDETYLESSSALHHLTKTYGTLPSIPVDVRPEPQDIRRQISRHLTRAISTRESAYAEASRLYDVVDRHFNRLSSIISKLQDLPQPPSRDPTPVPPSTTSPRFRQGGRRRSDADDVPLPRITLRLDGARSANAARPSAQGRRDKRRHRRITVPGEVLPPPTLDSPVSSDSEWQSLPPSPMPVAESRGAGHSRRDRKHNAASYKIPKIPKAPKGPKLPKLPKLKLPNPAGSRRPPGAMGTNVHSAVAGISTSNALALLKKPPENAVAGSEDAPWLKLTPYEMAKLRKRMKKNAVWNPSETMIRRELADLGRGPDNYHAAKARSDATGEPFVDHANIAENARLGEKKELEEGEISVDSLGMEELQLSNRGMKLNEAKKLKKENQQKEQAAQAAVEAEEAARRLADSGSALKAIFRRGEEGDESLILSPSTGRGRGRDSTTPSRKRKRDDSRSSDGIAPTAEAKDKKRKREAPAASTASTTAKVSLAAPGSDEASTPSADKKATTAAPTSHARRTSVKPEAGSGDAHAHAQASRRGSRFSTATPTNTPGTVGRDRPRRASTISIKLNEPALPTRPAVRRSRRPVPGLVKESAEGGAAVSVGTRKAPPRRKGGSKQAQEKAEKEESDSDNMPIDPNEPTYCVCGDVSFGTMIACENNDCEREWFHLECVGLEDTPGRTTKWYCPDCRRALGMGDKGPLSVRGRKR